MSIVTDRPAGRPAGSQRQFVADINDPTAGAVAVARELATPVNADGAGNARRTVSSKPVPTSVSSCTTRGLIPDHVQPDASFEVAAEFGADRRPLVPSAHPARAKHHEVRVRLIISD